MNQEHIYAPLKMQISKSLSNKILFKDNLQLLWLERVFYSPGRIGQHP